MMRTPTGNPQTAPRPTVLIAIGDADSRALYRVLLLERSYVIHECEDGAQALGMAIALRPDLIIASSHLARIDGFTLCRLLRSDPETRSTGILLLMTGDNVADAVRAKSAGADAALEAPCAPDAVLAALHDVLERPLAGPAASRPMPVDSPSTTESPRRPRARTFRREQTTTPPLAPPALHCPGCQAPLAYQHSQTGGVNDRSFEQWDYFRCQTCGPYQYRHRTRKLRTI